MVSVCNSRSVLHQNRIQESVLELLPGIALEKTIERSGVLACPRKRIHPTLVPCKSPRGAELGQGADHLAAFFRPAACRRMNSAAPSFLRPMYAARALGSSAPSFLSCVASLLNFDFFFMLLLDHQARHDHVLGLVISLAVSQLCRARKFFRRSGSSRLISILGSPKRTLITVPLGLRT
jgi:hypothetical protein